MARLTKQTLDGNIQTLILSHLVGGPSYGYRIVRELNDLGDGLLRLGEGTVYPVLHRMEDQGLIKADWREAGSPGRPRKYYKPTAKGRKVLQGQREQWAGLVQVMQRALGSAE